MLLMSVYRVPLERYLAKKARIHVDEAANVVNDFLVDRIYQSPLVERADPARGRFRSYLCTSLYFYWVSELRTKERRDASVGNYSLDNMNDTLLDPSVGTPEHIFDAMWARELIQRVIDKMQEKCRQEGNNIRWAIFEQLVLEKVFKGRVVSSYKSLAEQYHLPSPEVVNTHRITSIRIFKQLFRETVAEYIGPEETIEDEISHLFKSLANVGRLS